MDLRERFRDILFTISDEPDFKKTKAEERFLLIKEYQIRFEKRERYRMGESFRKDQVIQQFCTVKNISPATFQNWLQAYRSGGINGLLPKYGNRKGHSQYRGAILPILAEIIEPGDGISAVYKKLTPICQQLSIKTPSQKTVGRIMEAAGLISIKRKGRKITTIKASFTVDTQKPLTCLHQLSDFISECDVFNTDVKEASLKQLGSFLKLISREKPLRLAKPLTSAEVKILTKYMAGLHKNHSAKATAILMVNENTALAEVVKAAGRHPATVLGWIKRFNEKHIEFIEVKLHHPERAKRLEQRANRIIDIIHAPPSAYNINRTTWTYEAITKVYFAQYSETISTKTVERVVKQSGCSWRRVRIMQTSLDPEYRQKIERLLDTLQGLRDGERFFFIDEVGPYRVRKYGGRVLVAADEIPTLPEQQKSRGKVQFVAALEAVTNQLKWIFTADKSADSMVGLLESIACDYADTPAIFLTWDAISVHSSKTVNDWIASHNSSVIKPRIEVVPLPSHAQFLNVIESVFGGMKKAVICNSDYATPHDMQQAIAGHFEARNAFYKENPKRAGNKIWDKQRFDFDKLAGGIFKKM